jgi:hypothetical protein
VWLSLAPKVLLKGVKMSMTLQKKTSTLVTDCEEMEALYPVFKISLKPGSRFEEQTISYIELPEEGHGEPLWHEKLEFRFRDIEADGPILPYEDKVGGVDMGPKRPQVKVCFLKDDPRNKAFQEFELRVRCAYIGMKTGLIEAFPQILTFFPIKVQLKPDRHSRADQPPQTAYQVGVITRALEVIPLDNLFENMTPAQSAAYAAMNTAGLLVSKACLIDEKPVEVYVFDGLKSRVHQKSESLFFEMNLRHASYPGDVRKYRFDGDTRDLSNIKHWGIKIPRLMKMPDDRYAMIEGSNWTEEGGFTPITGPKDRNRFIATMRFFPEKVMASGKNFRTWWSVNTILKQPEESRMKSGDDYGEDIVDTEGKILKTFSLGTLLIKSREARRTEQPAGSPASARVVRGSAQQYVEDPEQLDEE